MSKTLYIQAQRVGVTCDLFNITYSLVGSSTQYPASTPTGDSLASINATQITDGFYVLVPDNTQIIYINNFTGECEGISTEVYVPGAPTTTTTTTSTTTSTTTEPATTTTSTTTSTTTEPTTTTSTTTSTTTEPTTTTTSTTTSTTTEPTTTTTSTTTSTTTEPTTTTTTTSTTTIAPVTYYYYTLSVPNTPNVDCTLVSSFLAYSPDVYAEGWYNFDGTLYYITAGAENTNFFFNNATPSSCTNTTTTTSTTTTTTTAPTTTTTSTTTTTTTLNSAFTTWTWTDNTDNGGSFEVFVNSILVVQQFGSGNTGPYTGIYPANVGDSVSINVNSNGNSVTGTEAVLYVENPNGTIVFNSSNATALPNIPESISYSYTQDATSTVVGQSNNF